MRRARAFLRLPRGERLAAVEAMAEILVASAAVGRVPPARWRRPLTVAATPRPAPSADPNAEGPVRAVRHALSRAARSLWFAPRCLPLALAGQRMLARRGVAADLWVGTARAAALAPGEDRFHAWLKVGGRFVTGDCDESRYALFAPADSGAAHTNA